MAIKARKDSSGLGETPDWSAVKTLTRAILVVIGTGALVATALVAPNIIQVLGPFLKRGKRTNYERERIRQAMRALHRRRLVGYKERNGVTYIEVTEQGEKYVRKYHIDRMRLTKGTWDQRWRVILFDIPEHRRAARRAFQSHLKRLGCFSMQKSVWVYPYPCRDEIDFLASFWDVHPFVRYLEATDLGISEGAARRFFGLL